ILLVEVMSEANPPRLLRDWLLTYSSPLRNGLKMRIPAHVVMVVRCHHQTFRYFGGARRNRTADEGFADLCLTTWLPRPCPKKPALQQQFCADCVHSRRHTIYLHATAANAASAV